MKHQFPKLQKAVQISRNELNLAHRKISQDYIKASIPQEIVKPKPVPLHQKEPNPLSMAKVTNGYLQISHYD